MDRRILIPWRCFVLPDSQINFLIYICDVIKFSFPSVLHFPFFYLHIASLFLLPFVSISFLYLSLSLVPSFLLPLSRIRQWDTLKGASQTFPGLELNTWPGVTRGAGSWVTLTGGRDLSYWARGRFYPPQRWDQRAASDDVLRREAQRTSARAADLRIEIWNQDLSNKKQEDKSVGRDVRLNMSEFSPRSFGFTFSKS